MNKRWLLLVPLPAALAAGAWFEPTHTVRGWVKGEPFFAGRSASYWGEGLTSSDPERQAKVPEQLVAGKSESVPVLTRLLTSSDSQVRWHAVDVLGKIGPDAAAATPALLDRLNDRDPFVRAVAIDAIATIKPDRPEVMPGLVARLKSDDRDKAIRALSVFGPVAQTAVPDLIEVLTNRQLPPATRWNAARTLGKIGPGAKAAVPALVGSMTDADELVREHAAEALGDIGPDAESAVPHLVKALADPSAKVRRDAVRSLGQLGSAAAAAAPAVEKLQTDKEEIVRDAAKTALRRVAPEKKN